MDSTKLFAWWGAGLSSVTFLWDIFKYFRLGPKLRFKVVPGMVLMPSDGQKTFIQTEITNCGDRPTTLTNITLSYFEKQWSWARLRNRPSRAAVLINPSIPDSNVSQPLPCELKPGGVWRGLTAQEPQLEIWARNGVLYFDLYHSHDVKPIRRRLTLRPYRPGPPVRL